MRLITHTKASIVFVCCDSKEPGITLGIEISRQLHGKFTQHHPFSSTYPLEIHFGRLFAPRLLREFRALVKEKRPVRMAGSYGSWYISECASLLVNSWTLSRSSNRSSSDGGTNPFGCLVVARVRTAGKRGLVNLVGALEGRERNRRGKRVVAMVKISVYVNGVQLAYKVWR